LIAMDPARKATMEPVVPWATYKARVSVVAVVFGCAYPTVRRNWSLVAWMPAPAATWASLMAPGFGTRFANCCEPAWYMLSVVVPIVCYPGRNAKSGVKGVSG
jgi:hypothetical protein